jgi:hypothetical protein
VTREALLFVLLLSPHALSAQAPDPASAGASGLSGFAEVSVRAASLHGSVRPLLGVAALLGLAESWRLGGGGLFVSGGTELETDGPLAGSELHLGYGGVMVERTLWGLSRAGTPSSSTLRGRVLVGMGNGSIRDPVTRVRFRSDNFLLIEPVLSLNVRLGGHLGGAVLAGYRIALGVQDLDVVDGAELGGWGVGLSLELGPF